MRLGFLIACGLLWACSDEPSGPPPREVRVETVVEADGRSPEVGFEVPPGTRSVTVVVEGRRDALYALGQYTFGRAVDQVALPAGPPGALMRASYLDEQIGEMPGELLQSIRLGTFTHVYPYRPGQEIVSGPATLRVASDMPGPITVRILMPEDDGANVLPINFVVVSDTLFEPNTEQFMTELQRIFAQADITVTVGSVERLTGTDLEQITQFSEPQERPDSQAARLTALVTSADGPGIDVFLVEALPSGVGGLSLGTPGPPLRGSYYYGVVIAGGQRSIDSARVTAHEVAHFLALQHVQNVGISGTTYDDPLDDTTAGVDNLMEDGTVLTAGQAFALSRSALLLTTAP